MNGSDSPRAALEKHLGRPLLDDQWDFLVAKGYEQDILLGERGSREVAEELKEWLAVMGGGPAGDTSARPRMLGHSLLGESERAARQQAVSILLSKEAEKDDRLIAFRKTHLPDEVLAWEDVREWIGRRAMESGAPTQYLEVSLPEGSVVRGDAAQDGCIVEPELQVRTVPAGSGVKSRSLKFGTPDGRSSESVATVAGSVLEELRRTADRLAGRFEWTAEQAAVFVLTGITPLHALVRTKRTIRPLLPVVSRIELSVDPSVTPEELAEYYRASRARMMPGHRHRSQSLRAMQLAVFASYRDQSEDWEESWRVWNASVRAKHPDWEYGGSQKRNFRRDLKMARARLLFPPYVDPLGRGRVGKDDPGRETIDIVIRMSGEDDR